MIRRCRWIEAVVAANGERVMALVNEAASRGVEWEALLLEMQTLMHRIAMVQLTPSALGSDMAPVEHRVRELARTVPPTDVQLYYQTLLIGRKELPYAPDRRMGVEMTLLRALAFHPRTPLPAPEAVQHAFAPTAVMTPQQVAPQRLRPRRKMMRRCRMLPASAGGAQAVAASAGSRQSKKSEPAAASRARPVNNAALERLASVTERAQSRLAPSALEQTPAKKRPIAGRPQPSLKRSKKSLPPKALKKRWSMKKRRSWRRNWRKKPLNAMPGLRGQPA